MFSLAYNFKICLTLCSEAGDGFSLSRDSCIKAFLLVFLCSWPKVVSLWELLFRSAIARLCRMFALHLLRSHLVLQYYIKSEIQLTCFTPVSWPDLLICIAARFKWRIIVKSVQILVFPTSSILVEVNPDFWELYETKGVGTSEFKLLLAQGEVTICFSPLYGHVSASDHTWTCNQVYIHLLFTVQSAQGGNIWVCPIFVAEVPVQPLQYRFAKFSMLAVNPLDALMSATWLG